LTPARGSPPRAPLVLAMNYVLRTFAIVSKKYGPIICWGLCAFVLTSIVQEFWRGVAIRRRNTGQDVLSSFIGMILRGKRRYGGYLVHIGIMLMCFAWAASAYQQEKVAKLAPGETAKLGAYTVRFDKLAHEADHHRERVAGDLTALLTGTEY